MLKKIKNNIGYILILLLLILALISVLIFLFKVGTYENEEKHTYKYYVKEELSEDVLKWEVIRYGVEDVFEETWIELIVEIVLSTTHNTLETKKYYVYISWYSEWNDNNFIEKIKYNLTSIKPIDRPFLKEKITNIEIKEIINNGDK